MACPASPLTSLVASQKQEAGREGGGEGVDGEVDGGGGEAVEVVACRGGRVQKTTEMT